MSLGDRLLYWIFCAIGYCLGLLPQWILNIKANCIYAVVYRLVGYRRRVVMTNLRYAFPKKSKEELHTIEKRFYLHLSDVLIETFALLGWSKKRNNKRYRFTNIEEYRKLNDKCGSRSIIVALSHFGNWEMAMSLAQEFDRTSYAIYHPLSSKGAEKFYKKMRSKHGMNLVTMNNTGRIIAQHNNDRSAIGLIADQAPIVTKDDSWVEFLGRKTSFVKGIDAFSMKYGMPMLYLSTTKTRRGHYEATFKTIWDGESPITSQELLQRYASMLEEDIRREPHLWLWSHKRWKHTISYKTPRK